MKKINLIFIVLNITLLILGFSFIKKHIFSRVDDFIYSKIFSLSVNKYNIPTNKIILLKVDKKFFNKMGVTNSTFHRGYYATLLQKLQDYGVRNITFDVYFGDLKYGNRETKIQQIYNKSLQVFDEEFTKYIDNKVILGTIPYNKKGELLMPSKKFLRKKAWVGHVESHLNKSSINNGLLPYLYYKNKKILNLGYITYLNSLYLIGKIDKNIKVSIIKSKNLIKPDILHIQTSNKKYNIKIPLSKDYKQNDYIFVPLFNNLKGIKSYSIYDIITDKDNVYKEIFKGKYVFIGATDSTLNDIKLSYIGMIPGVMYHINQFLSINNQKYTYIAPNMITSIILTLIFIISYIFVIAFKDEKLSIITFVVLIGFLSISFYYIFLLYGIIIPLGTIIVIFFIKLLLDIFHILFINQDRKEFVTNLFNKYIGKKVLTKKDSKGKKVAEKKNIALMFSDIASFTNISEKLKPQEVIDMLNIYFEKTNTPIIKSKGFIDKYVGDAIMAFWEDTQILDNIIYSIIQIQRIHPQIMENIKQNLGKDINIFTRIGLHYGEAIVGDVGDNKSKISYTAIGDNVNLASRLEGINKYYGTCIIMSENFYKKIEKKEEYAIRLVDKITVKGKSQPVKIYEAMPYYTHEIDYELVSYIKEFEKMLIFYFKGNFKRALELVEKLQVLNIGKKDKVLTLYFERLKTLIDNPPKNWTGVCKFTTK